MLADKLNLVKKNIEEACDTAGRLSPRGNSYCGQ